jgi:hypothetical protein
LDPSANKTIVSSSRSLDNATTANNLMSEGANSPPSPVGLAVLQTWDLAKLGRSFYLMLLLSLIFLYSPILYKNHMHSVSKTVTNLYRTRCES